MQCVQIPNQAGSVLVFLSLYPNAKADLAASQKREDAFRETATSYRRFFCFGRRHLHCQRGRKFRAWLLGMGQETTQTILTDVGSLQGQDRAVKIIAARWSMPACS